jgi:hypothetical protein
MYHSTIVLSPNRPHLVFLERIQDGLDETAQKFRQLDRVKFHAPSLLKARSSKCGTDCLHECCTKLAHPFHLKSIRSCNHPMHDLVVLFQSGHEASRLPAP